MQLVWFCVGLICFYFGTDFAFRFWTKKQTDKSFLMNFPATVAGFLSTVFLLGVALCHIIFRTPKISNYTMLSCLVIFVLFLSAKWPEKKKIWIPIVCASGTYVLHRLLPTMPLSWMSFILMTLAWISVMTLVILFDVLPFLSAFTVAAWAIAFSTVVLTMESVPLLLTVACWLLVVGLWAMLKSLSAKMVGCLGPYASAFLGFVMGGIIAVCIGARAYSSAFALMSYYLFEGALFLLAYLGLHPLTMNKGDFAYLVALQKGNPSRLIKSLFYHLVVLSLIAVLVWSTKYSWAVIFVTTIVLADLYNKFHLFGKEEPTLKSMWKDTKESCKALWQQRQTLINGTSEKVQKTVSKKVVSVSKEKKMGRETKVQHLKRKKKK